MDDTTNLKLPYIMAAQAQKHVTHNEAIRALDAIVQLMVLDRDLSTPPASPAEGDRYIVAAAATGAWAGQENGIAAWQDGAWAFYTANEGWLAWLADENALVVWDGTGWIAATAGGGGGSVNPVPLVGVNATADTINRLSVSSPASLFNHEGAGHQLKINKNAAADTASFLFQDGFSGRAEIGLTGDDSFHFKVSPDGTTFYESILLDPADGSVSFPQDAAFSSFLDLDEITALTDPAANTARLYAKDDGGTTRLAMRDAGGAETIFGAGGGGGTPSGSAGAVQFSDGSAFASDGANYFWDDTNKRLGVNTNTPTVDLHVVGAKTRIENTGASAAFQCLQTDGKAMNLIADTGARLNFDDSGIFVFAAQSRANLELGNLSGITNIMKLTAAGAVRFYTYGAGTLQTDAVGNMTASSDERLKNIKNKFNRGLQAISNVVPITYRWNSDSGLDPDNDYHGFSAQNLQQYIPEAVSQGPDGLLTVSDRTVIAALLNAVNELAQQVKDLQR